MQIRSYLEGKNWPDIINTEINFQALLSGKKCNCKFWGTRGQQDPSKLYHVSAGCETKDLIHFTIVTPPQCVDWLAEWQHKAFPPTICLAAEYFWSTVTGKIEHFLCIWEWRTGQEENVRKEKKRLYSRMVVKCKLTFSLSSKRCGRTWLLKALKAEVSQIKEKIQKPQCSSPQYPNQIGGPQNKVAQQMTVLLLLQVPPQVKWPMPGYHEQNNQAQ